jgi:hypothetical protein
MADKPPNDEKSFLENMPKWPEEARDLPDLTSRPEPKRRFLWAYVFAVLGVLSGVGNGLKAVPRDGASVAIGYLIGSAMGGDERKRRWRDN